LPLQQRNGDIVDRNAASSFAVTASIMRMAVNHQVGPMAVDDFSQA
jgi:hypothetical protein